MNDSNGAHEGIEFCHVQHLFGALLDDEALHISSRKTKYRNKITYSLPLASDTSYSDLASDVANDVCRSVQEWSNLNSCSGSHLPSESTQSSPRENRALIDGVARVKFREIMVKVTRAGRILMRLTIESSRPRTVEDGGGCCDDYNGTHIPEDHADPWPDAQAFRDYLQSRFPSMTCLCYNLADETSAARPSKESPLCFLTDDRFVTEVTPNGLEYQIGPDTFSEVNHEVELLQWEKTREWIENIVTLHRSISRVPATSSGSMVTDAPLQAPKTILIVSGRDVSSFGLSFGSLLYSESPPDPSTSCENRKSHASRIFDHVIAIQHCPLVHRDALANFERHKDKVNATVLHMSKGDMVHGFEREIAKFVCSETGQRPLVVGVMTGGRKGLDPAYVDYLIHNPSIVGIIYNSCATKSLVRDMRGFLRGGFAVQDFRSYDFLPGTGYTASLTQLVRRPRTLILPIGPAGVGKSCLSADVVRQYATSGVVWWNRDVIFSALRQQGTGLAKSKQLVHQSLLECLQAMNRDNETLTPAEAISPFPSPSIIIVDSTNGNTDARKLYVQQARPDQVVLVVFQLEPGADEHEVIDFLLKRTADRLGENAACHPSFPNTILEQREKHRKILQGIDYPIEQPSYEETQSIVVRFDPRESTCPSTYPTASLCYQICLCCSVASTSLRNHLLQAKEKLCN